MRLLVTGAGFSKAWGLPLTRELAEVTCKTLEGMENEGLPGTAQHLVLFLKELQRVHGPHPDLEDVLTILREGMDEEYEPGWMEKAPLVWNQLKLDQSTLWQLPGLGVADPAYHYYALQWGLGATLNWNGWGAPPDGIKRSWFGIPQAYARLLAEHGPFDAVISLNYDVVPEYMFFGPIDYGLPEDQMLDVLDHVNHDYQAANGQWVSRVVAEPRRVFPGGKIVLKLHGSVNMAYCPTCEKMLVYPRRLPGDREPAEQLAWLGTAAYNCTLHCGEVDDLAPSLSPGRLQPLMVPPVNNKEQLPQWNLLNSIQERAVELAAKATEVVIVGASLRPSDQALTNVMEAVRCPVKLIGGADASARLKELGIGFTLLRPYLEETPEDRTKLVPNKRAVDFRQVGPDEQLGPGATIAGMDRQTWRRLPSIQADTTYLAVRMGCWKERGKPPEPEGTFPTMDVLEAGGQRRLRIPIELREWVRDRVGLAHYGARDIPGRVRFTRDMGKWSGHVFGP